LLKQPFEFGLHTEFFAAARQALSGSIPVEASETERAEVAIRHHIAQHMVSSGKDRSSHRQDGLFWSAASSQPQELGEIVVPTATRRRAN
jgi:hypothetical protein